MIRIPFVVVLVASILVIAITVSAETLPRGAQLVGMARSKSVEPAFDKQLQGELDKLLPQLKQLNSDAAILIEAFFPQTKGNTKSQQITMAFTLAEQVQHYLNITRSLNREFFIAIWENPEEISSFPRIRVTTYPRDYFEN